MTVKRNTLLLVACLVWCAAGGNILRIGVMAYTSSWTWLNVCASIFVFSVFHACVFIPLVRKHTARIRAYKDERCCCLRCFDLKSFMIMAVMMTGGIALRSRPWMPIRCVAVFYTGLGAALVLAGLLFGHRYAQAWQSARRAHHTA